MTTSASRRHRRSSISTRPIAAWGRPVADRTPCPSTLSGRGPTSGPGRSCLSTPDPGETVMPIDWDAETHEFHLHTEQVSYVVGVLENGALGQLHVGAPLTTGRSYRHLAPGEFRGFDNRLGDAVALEYPTEGTGDYRVPAIAVELANGSSALSLAYVRYRIIAGKPPIPGLPSTYVESDSEADTLEVTLADPAAGVEVDLRYSVFTGRPIIARSAVIRNTGAGPIELRCAMSASLDLP